MTMTRTMWRICGLWLLSLGLPSLYLAQWGALWQAGTVEYLGWSELYVLRPGLYLFGVIVTWLGLWHLTIRWTTFGYVYDSWREACYDNRHMDDMYGWPPEQRRTNWRDDLEHALYMLRRCAIGRHDPTALWYSDGGEDGPRGTHCADCGIRVSRQNVTIKRFPCDRDQWLDDYATLARPEQDDGCYTQGSDPVRRTLQ